MLVTGLRQIHQMAARTADGAMRTTRGAEQQSWAALQAMRSITSSGRGVIVSLLEGNRLGRGVFVDALRISRLTVWMPAESAARNASFSMTSPVGVPAQVEY